MIRRAKKIVAARHERKNDLVEGRTEGESACGVVVGMGCGRRGVVKPMFLQYCATCNATEAVGFVCACGRCGAPTSIVRRIG